MRNYAAEAAAAGFTGAQRNRYIREARRIEQFSRGERPGRVASLWFRFARYWGIKPRGANP